MYKLKQDHEKYKLTYDLLKEETVHKKELLLNSAYLEELESINENLQRELSRFKKALVDKDMIINKLQERYDLVNKKLKFNMQNLREIENARRELNQEISYSNLRSESYFQYNDTQELMKAMITAMKSNPTIYRIFKDIVQCTKRFEIQVQQENYYKGFTLLCQFIIELIDSYQFCEDSTTEAKDMYADIEIEENDSRGRTLFREDIKKSTQYKEGLTKRSQENFLEDSSVTNNMKTYSKVTSTDKNKDRINQQSLEFEKINEKLQKLTSSKSKTETRYNHSIDKQRSLVVKNPFLSDEKKASISNLTTMNLQSSEKNFTFNPNKILDTDKDLVEIESMPSTSKNTMSANKSKSPTRRFESTRSKYDDYMSPVLRKTDCSKSVAEALSYIQTKNSE